MIKYIVLFMLITIINIKSGEATDTELEWQCEISGATFQQGQLTSLTFDVNTSLQRGKFIQLLVEGSNSEAYAVGLSGYYTALEKHLENKQPEEIDDLFLLQNFKFIFNIEPSKIIKDLNSVRGIDVDGYEWYIPTGKKTNKLDGELLIYCGVNGDKNIKMSIIWGDAKR